MEVERTNYASKGMAGTGLGLVGIAGTALGLLNGGLGGAFAGGYKMALNILSE